MTLLESEKALLESMVKDKNSFGMDNLLRTHLDEIEGLIGTAKGFLEKEEVGPKDNKELKDMPKLGIKKPLLAK